MHPEVRVVLADRPEVLELVRPAPEHAGRLTLRAIDLRAPWVTRGDGVVLARVLHDWDNGDASAILGQAREALAPGGRLFVIEMLLDERGFGGALCDLHLLAVSGGRERTRAEYERLLDAAGFTLTRVSRLPALCSVIEGAMSDVELVVPPSTLRWIAEAPTDRPVAVLIRHSARPPLPVDDTGFTVPLTDVGVRIAEQLGDALCDRLVGLHASPLVRCVQTAEALARGSGRPLPITPDRMLGDPGAFVLDGRHAWAVWKERGHEGVMTQFCTADDALPGMARPAYAARSLVHHMLAACSGTPGLHVFVTHDSLITATAARILDEPLGREG